MCPLMAGWLQQEDLCRRGRSAPDHARAALARSHDDSARRVLACETLTPERAQRATAVPILIRLWKAPSGVPSFIPFGAFFGFASSLAIGLDRVAAPVQAAAGRLGLAVDWAACHRFRSADLPALLQPVFGSTTR